MGGNRPCFYNETEKPFSFATFDVSPPGDRPVFAKNQVTMENQAGRRGVINDQMDVVITRNPKENPNLAGLETFSQKKSQLSQGGPRFPYFIHIWLGEKC